MTNRVLSILFLIVVVDSVFAGAAELVTKLPGDRETKSSVSNVLKTKHDTVKNSINNIR
jgi:hypothetical protein